MFLHKSCAELPLETRHPAHPHPLALSTEMVPSGERCGTALSDGILRGEFSKEVFVYRCGDCSFSLNVTWVFRALFPSEGEEQEKGTIRHFADDHPLTYFHFNKPIKVECRACEQQIAGPFYGCPICSFYLHESCTQLELAREIAQHPFHPEHHLTLFFPASEVRCDACCSCIGKEYNAFAYKCNECRFNLDVRCATSFLPFGYKQEDCRAIEHFSHQHQLVSFSVKMENMDIRCKACELKISGEVYGCPDCKFFLHRSCKQELPQEMSHFLHPDHPLIFRAKPTYPGGTFACDSCMCVSSGCTFSCEECSFDLDLVCALSTFSAIKEGVATEIQHFSHDHSLTLIYRRTALGCIICGGSVLGLAYSCLTCDSLHKSFLLHKSCAKLPQESDHPFHPAHPLTLQSKKHFFCEADGVESEGFCFCCDKCQFFLGVGAASLKKPTLKHRPHEHDLFHFKRLGGLKCCNYCGKKSSVDSYRCVQCDFTVHYDCIRILPLSIKHDTHFHPLALLDKLIVKHHEDQQYCDACERTRRPDRGVYYCAECNFAAHIGCAIPSVEIEETKPAELEKVDREIARLVTDIQQKETNIEAMQIELEESRKRLEELRMKRDDLAI
ncbi:hypothetical protein CDL15_Pgr000763 [Punica granatum]|uniref:Phorbol-ester/DAG-type domain-containing protein n=1 Tax=Punica granatum TaxID=22663 RepID=A0A218W504_PUNGR|nr:hypothetical protein CDL15_Pgr000763 [Punica granatum]PKI49158.1 hypothetical protein CRG98_030436 [Punica granatum]